MLAALLLAGCAPTWQAPAGMSPEAQASDQAACEEEARQAAMAQTGTGADAAVAQMLSFAQVLSAEGDVEGAARVLDEVLLLEPNQAEAIAMLRSLGYALPSDAYEEPDEVSVDEYGAPAQPA